MFDWEQARSAQRLIDQDTTHIRKVQISLMLRPRDYFIHQRTTLREEFICLVSGRFINVTTNFIAQA
jgi:hypothetical protein